MRKSAKSNAQQDKRKRAKEARRWLREHNRQKSEEKRRQKRLAAFRRQGQQQIALAAQALLQGAAAAGVDLQPDDIKGYINSNGEGKLKISDRVSPRDVKRAHAEAVKLMEEPKYKAVRSARGKKTHLLVDGKASCGQSISEPYREPTDDWCAKCHTLYVEKKL